MASDKSPTERGENCEEQKKPRTIEQKLARIAHKVYPEHLRRFATTLLGIQDARFSQITHGHENWDKSYQVRSHIFTDKSTLPKYINSLSVVKPL